jgi:hypothetical protein
MKLLIELLTSREIVLSPSNGTIRFPARCLEPDTSLFGRAAHFYSNVAVIV